MIYKGFKFDLRIYVLVAGCNPLRIYIYEDGLVRLAAEKYERVNKENKDNKFKHLTNYAVSKQHSSFFIGQGNNPNPSQSSQTLDSGHKLSLESFLQTLSSQGFRTDLTWSSIKKLALFTILSIQPMLQHAFNVSYPDDPFHQACFEVLGLDVLLDDCLKPHLLEVNHSPSLGVDSSVDGRVKENLVRDTLNLLGLCPQTRSSLHNLRATQLKATSLGGHRQPLSKGAFRQSCLRERQEVIERNKGKWQEVWVHREESGQLGELATTVQDLLQKADENYGGFTGALVRKRDANQLASVMSKTFQRGQSGAPKLSSFDHLEAIYGQKTLIGWNKNKNSIKVPQREDRKDHFRNTFSINTNKEKELDNGIGFEQCFPLNTKKPQTTQNKDLKSSLNLSYGVYTDKIHISKTGDLNREKQRLPKTSYHRRLNTPERKNMLEAITGPLPKGFKDFKLRNQNRKEKNYQEIYGSGPTSSSALQSAQTSKERFSIRPRESSKEGYRQIRIRNNVDPKKTYKYGSRNQSYL